MDGDDLAYRGAAELARAIRERELGSVEVCEALMERIRRHDGQVNAVVTLDVDAARAAAEHADAELTAGRVHGPLHGVPMTVKDMHRTKGLRTTCGMPWLMRWVPDADGTAVTKLRAAGAIVLGKTNVPFAGYDWQTRHPRFGPTNNPWDRTRTPGGSSGGSAAALAAGFTPLELGSDLAGSIRIPSHFCGVFGLMPTERRVSTAGHAPRGYPVLRNMLAVGPLARSVADLRLGFDVVANDPRAKDSERVDALTGRRFAWTDSLGGVPVDDDTRATLVRLTQALEHAGARVERVCPDIASDASAIEVWGAVNGFEFVNLWPPPLRWSFVRWLFRLGPVALTVGRSPFSHAMARGMSSSPRRYFAALERRDEWSREFDRFLSHYDAFLCPASAAPAFTHRKLPRAIDASGVRVPYSMAQAAFMCPFNVAGNPVVVVPAGRSRDGLPIGVQLVGHKNREHALLDIAAHIEALEYRGASIVPSGRPALD